LILVWRGWQAPACLCHKCGPPATPSGARRARLGWRPYKGQTDGTDLKVGHYRDEEGLAGLKPGTYRGENPEGGLRAGAAEEPKSTDLSGSR